MIQLHIYIKGDKAAELLAQELLTQKLVAHVSIDYNNQSFLASSTGIVREVNCLLTAQTRALLFPNVLDLVKTHEEDQIKLYSTPIAQCNEVFFDLIQQGTLVLNTSQPE